MQANLPKQAKAHEDLLGGDSSGLELLSSISSLYARLTVIKC